MMHRRGEDLCNNSFSIWRKPHQEIPALPDLPVDAATSAIGPGGTRPVISAARRGHIDLIVPFSRWNFVRCNVDAWESRPRIFTHAGPSRPDSFIMVHLANGPFFLSPGFTTFNWTDPWGIPRAAPRRRGKRDLPR